VKAEANRTYPAVPLYTREIPSPHASSGMGRGLG
jgi:hypothetical protein